MVILAFDTYYFDDKARTVCLQFNEWKALKPVNVYTEVLQGIAGYVPGQFYKRELPCILSLRKQIDLAKVEAIVIDGYVYVDDHKTPGLGGHLYEALQQKIAVIGVAKTNFKTLNNLKLPLYRGNSKNPLFITSIGIDLQAACNNISTMAGPYRMPTLLKTLDTLTKTHK